MIVICLEGCHGCGKTQLCREFENAGFEILDEAFLDMPANALHPQSLTMECAWQSYWFQRLLRKQHDLSLQGNDREKIFIADRSPFSAAFYSKRGNLIEPIIREEVLELREQANIYVYTVYLQVQVDLLWSRIQNRLLLEPERKKYREDSREWMDETVDFYESHSWDFTVKNNENTLRQLMQDVVLKLAQNVRHFRDACPNSPAIRNSPAWAECEFRPVSPANC